MSEAVLIEEKSGVADMTWFTSVSGFTHDKSARLCRLGLVPGAFQSQARTRGSKWHFKKARTLKWLESLEAK
jgi:hypothetical protein